MSWMSANPWPCGPPFWPERVVALALLGIGQDLVRAGDLLEALLRLRVLVDVGVMLARELAIGAADVVGGGAAFDAEHLVQIACRGGHGYWSSSVASSESRFATAFTDAIALR